MSSSFRTIMEKALGPLEDIGLSDVILYAYFNNSGLIERVNDIDKKITNFNPSNKDSKGEIIIPYTHSQGETDYLLGFLGHALRTRGYTPLFVSCRGTLPLCLRKVDRSDSRGTCIACKYRSDTVLEAYGFETVKMSDYADVNNLPELPKDSTQIMSSLYKGVDVSKYAKATSRRHLRKYNIDMDDKEEEGIFRRYLKASMYYVEFTNNIIDSRGIVAAVGNHPAYVYGGVLLDTASKRNIPAISYGGGYFRKDAVMFGNMKNRKGFEVFSDYEKLTEVLSEPLSSEEYKEVKKYIEGRKDGTTIRDINQYVSSSEGNINLDSAKKVVCIFTNLLWDGSLSGSSVAFESPFDWISETLAFAENKEEIELIVKPHPAEVHRKTNIKVKEWIEETIDIPENVSILNANTDISPYALFDEIDVAVVYNSTVGLEAALHGTPVVTVGDTHYKELGFTIDPKNPIEYSNILNQVNKLELTEEEQKLAWRYAHFMFVKRHISIDGIDSVDSIHEVGHTKIETSDKFESIVDQIVNDETSIMY